MVNTFFFLLLGGLSVFQHDACKRYTYKHDIDNIILALIQYQSDKGYLPDHLCDLVDEYLIELPLDPCGRPYKYRNPGLHNEDWVDIYSVGRDGASKTGGDDPDDYNNWGNKNHRPSGTVIEIPLPFFICVVICIIIFCAALFFFYLRCKTRYSDEGG